MGYMKGLKESLVISSALLILLSLVGCGSSKTSKSTATQQEVEVEVQGVHAVDMLAGASGWCAVKKSKRFSAQVLERRTFGTDGSYNLSVQRINKASKQELSFLARANGKWKINRNGRRLSMSEGDFTEPKQRVFFNSFGKVNGQIKGFYQKANQLYFKWIVNGKEQVYYACTGGGLSESVAVVLSRSGYSGKVQTHTVVRKEKMLAELSVGQKEMSILFKKKLRVIYGRLVTSGSQGKGRLLGAVIQDGFHKSRFKEGEARNRKVVYDPMGVSCYMNLRAGRVHRAENNGKRALVIPAGTSFNIKRVRNQPRRVELVLDSPAPHLRVIKSIRCVSYMTVGSLTKRVLGGKAEIVQFR